MPFACPPWPPRWPEIDAAVAAALQSGQWGQYHAEIVSELQDRLKESIGTQQLRLCCSGTAALEIALRTLRLQSDDEVIVAAYDFPGNLRTVEILGARPVLVDIQPHAPTIDIGQLEKAAGPKVRAVIASHLYGHAFDVQALQEMCRRHDWILIEDACQVAGMKIDQKPAGSFGDLATLSFGGSKQLSAGNGGAVIANDERLAGRLGGLIDRPGDTFPLPPLAAAVLAPQLDRLDELNSIRNQAVKRIEERGEIGEGMELLIQTDPNVQPSYYKLALLAESAESRDGWIARMTRNGLPAGIGYRSAAKMSPRRCRKPVPLPNSQRLSERLCLLDHRALLAESLGDFRD